jgi:outer membrane receptor protein involved in Fe transport
MLSYRWRDGPTRWTAQLNVGNLFDKLYYASGSSFADPGAPRTVVASLRVGF